MEAIARSGVAAGERVTYTYDYAGNLVHVEEPFGVLTDFTRDSNGRIQEVVHRRADGLTLSEATYVLRADGTRESVVQRVRQPDGGEALSKTTWDYDALGRIIGERTDSGGDGMIDFSQDLVYDLVGNRIANTADNDGDGVPNSVVQYTYDQNDRLLLEEGREFDGRTANVTYDWAAAGSASGKGMRPSRWYATDREDGATVLQSADYGYSLTGRMVAAEVYRSEGGVDVFGSATYAYTFAFEGNGLLSGSTQSISQGEAGSQVSEVYLLDPFSPSGYAQVVEEWVPGDALPASSVMVGSRVHAEYSENGPQLLLPDALGSTQMVVTANGEVGATYTYDAFGNILSEELGITTGTDILYVGERWDALREMVQLRAREYSPSVGRFISEDPIAGAVEYPLSLHKYVYAHNNPMNFVDPSGQSLIEVLVSVAISSLQQAVKALQTYISKRQIIKKYERVAVAMHALSNVVVSASDPNPAIGIDDPTKIRGALYWAAGTIQTVNLTMKFLKRKHEKGDDITLPIAAAKVAFIQAHAGKTSAIPIPPGFIWHKGNGHPDFTPVLAPEFILILPVSVSPIPIGLGIQSTVFIGMLGKTGNPRAHDRRLANRVSLWEVLSVFGIRASAIGRWHHHELLGIMELVQERAHRDPHTGGGWYWDVLTQKYKYNDRPGVRDVE